MALEILSDANAMTRDQVRQAFRMTHNMALTLNSELARAGSCASSLLPEWRALRDRWVRFYSEGWSPRRLDEMYVFRQAFFRMRGRYILACGRAERDVPVYASTR